MSEGVYLWMYKSNHPQSTYLTQVFFYLMFIEYRCFRGCNSALLGGGGMLVYSVFLIFYEVLGFYGLYNIGDVSNFLPFFF